MLDTKAVREWFEINKPTVVIIAAAKVGGILANSKYPTQFLLDNLKIQNNLIETSWQTGVKRLLFLEVVVFIQNLLINLLRRISLKWSFGRNKSMVWYC